MDCWLLRCIFACMMIALCTVGTEHPLHCKCPFVSWSSACSRRCPVAVLSACTHKAKHSQLV